MDHLEATNDNRRASSRDIREKYYAERSAAYPATDSEAAIRYQLLVDRLIDLDIRPNNVVEIGCKYGDLVGHLTRLSSPRYLGLDIDASVIGDAPDLPNCNFAVVDADGALPVESASVDLLVAFEVLEHMESPLRFLLRSAEYLTPGGVLAVSVPNCYYFGEIKANLLKQPDTEGHLYSVTHQNLECLARFGGFEVVNSWGTSGRVPLVHRVTGKVVRFKTNRMLLTRSTMAFLRLCS